MGRASNRRHAITVSDRAERFDAVFGALRSTNLRSEPTPYIPVIEVWAEAHSDDYVVEIPFEASSWFAQATDEEIIDLAECDFGGNYPADVVAQHYDDGETERLFRYLESQQGEKNAPGFECHVDGDQARAWLNAYRPALAARL